MSPVLISVVVVGTVCIGPEDLLTVLNDMPEVGRYAAMSRTVQNIFVYLQKICRVALLSDLTVVFSDLCCT